MRTRAITVVRLRLMLSRHKRRGHVLEGFEAVSVREIVDHMGGGVRVPTAPTVRGLQAVGLRLANVTTDAVETGSLADVRHRPVRLCRDLVRVCAHQRGTGVQQHVGEPIQVRVREPERSTPDRLSKRVYEGIGVRVSLPGPSRFRRNDTIDVGVEEAMHGFEISGISDRDGKRAVRHLVDPIRNPLVAERRGGRDDGTGVRQQFRLARRVGQLGGPKSDELRRTRSAS